MKRFTQPVRALAIGGAASLQSVMMSPAVHGGEAKGTSLPKEISQSFRGMQGWLAQLDCEGGKWTWDQKSQELTTCVEEFGPQSRRCEIYFTGSDIRSKNINVKFEIRLNKALARPASPVIIFQVHSRPDQGEAWRCPMMALRTTEEGLQYGGVFDFDRISKSSNNCISDQGSIKPYEVFHGLDISSEHWHEIDLSFILGLSGAAYTSARIDGIDKGIYRGPNMLNDFSNPFIKMGVYGPEHMDATGPFCSTIRKFQMSAK